MGRNAWRPVHCWPDEDSAFPEPPPLKPAPGWFKLALKIYAQHVVFAEEMEKLARETSDRHERRRLRERAKRERARAEEALRLFETELPEDFDPAAYLRRCNTEL